MAQIEKRISSDGTVSWRVRIRRKGHPLITATFARKGGENGAEAWAEKTEAAIRDGRYFGSQEFRRRTINDLVDRYVREELPGLEETTRSTLAPRLAWWKAKLGEQLVADVTPATIKGALRELELKGKRGKRGAGPATLNRYQAAIRRVFTVAVLEWEWARENPAGGPRAGGRSGVKQKREPRGAPRFLSVEERARLLEACRASSERDLYPFVLVALTTGGRTSEILALRRRHVDEKRRRLVYEETKNTDPRSVKLPPVTLDALKAHLKVRPLADDRLFSRFPDKAWREARAAAKLDAPFRFHDLRHTFASYLAMKGASVRQLEEALGHRTLAMVQRYSHLTESHADDLVERIADGI